MGESDQGRGTKTLVKCETDWLQSQTGESLFENLIQSAIDW